MNTEESVVTVRVSKRALLVAATIFLALGGVSIWYAMLTPYQRCFSDACREQVMTAELQRIEDEWAPRIEAATRDYEEATRRVEEQKQHIKDIDRAIQSVECRKKGLVC